MEEAFMPLIKLLKEERTQFKKTIIFCQQQVHCGQLYHLFEKEMGPALSDPIGTPSSLPQYRLVNVFSKSTEDFVKETILLQATIKTSTLHVLICTSAFGMGIDCVGVERIIHWVPPEDIETYIQQTGRGGREGEILYYIIHFGKGLRRHCDKQMMKYCLNNFECRRNILFEDFKSYVSTGTKCNCCDICAVSCKCIDCLSSIN